MRKRDFSKVGGLWLAFLVLHLGYDFLPIAPLGLVAATNESVFQHMKGLFYAYVLVNIIEYVTRRKALDQRVAFIYARLLSTLLLPWVMFILWYMAPAYYGELPSIPLEIVYANVMVLLVGASTVMLERGFETMRYSRELKVLIIALFVISISLYTIFTFKLPWADVFAVPEGWE